MPLIPELKESYDRMLSYLEKLFKERFRKIREVVYKLHSSLGTEETIKSYMLSSDETMKNIAIKKYKEIVENTLASEREAYIERLAHEITILNEKALINSKTVDEESTKKIEEFEANNKKLRLQVSNLKKTIDELKNINEKTLSELEEKDKRLRSLESQVKDKVCDRSRNHDNIDILKRENSILATQLRNIEEELAESSNISKIQNKNASALEVSNNILSERCNMLEKENREYEEKLLYLNESQNRLNLQGITKLKNKVSKLKDALTQRNLQCTEYENEVFRANQVIEIKEKEAEAIICQYQTLKSNFDSEVKNKETQFLEKIKDIKDKNNRKIDKFIALMNQKIMEIEAEAVGQIREAKIKEEQALKNLQEKSNTLKQEYLTIHEHEKIVNEKIDYYQKRKKIELASISEKYEQEMRHLKETYSLKSTALNDKHKAKIADLNDKIGQLTEQKEVIREKDEEIIKLKNELRSTTAKLSSIEDKLSDAEKEAIDLQHNKENEIQSIRGKNAKLKSTIRELVNANEQIQKSLNEELSKSMQKIKQLEERLNIQVSSNKDLERDKIALEKTNAQIMQDYRHDLETLKEGMKAKAKEDEMLIKRAFEDKVGTTKVFKDTKQELEIITKELQLVRAECQQHEIRIRELNRVVDFTREKNLKLEQEHAIATKTLQLVMKESKNKKERMLNIYKSSFGALKAEVSFMKKNVKSEIEVLSRMMNNTIQSVMMKVKETMLKISTIKNYTHQEDLHKLESKIQTLEEKIRGKDKQIIQLEEKTRLQENLISEYDTDYKTLKEKMNEDLKKFDQIQFSLKSESKEESIKLESQYHQMIEELRSQYNEKIEEMRQFKQEIKKDLESKRMQKDMLTQSSVLQEIKRYERNIQNKRNDPLTLSQLECKRNFSTDNLKLDMLMKELDKKIKPQNDKQFNGSYSTASPTRQTTFANSKSTAGTSSCFTLSRMIGKENIS